jgi:hypothetical protein
MGITSVVRSVCADGVREGARSACGAVDQVLGGRVTRCVSAA